MRKILQQYFNIIGTVLIGLTFAFSTFFLLLNFYHYEEVNRFIYVDPQTNSAIIEYEETLASIEKNINALNNYNYNGSLSYTEANSMNSKFKTCLKGFKNDSYSNILNDPYVNSVDVYNLINSFENDVLNSCVVSQLYSLVSNNNSVKSTYFQNNKEILKSYMDDLLLDGKYVKLDLENNSSYYFNTSVAAMSIKSLNRDSFYEIISDYNKSAKFVKLISDWYYDQLSGGAINE